MTIAADLIPRVDPPEDNPELANEGRQGIVVEEMVFPHGPEQKSVVKESLKSRADLLLDWMRWRLIIDGHFKVTYAETGECVCGDYEIEVGNLDTLTERLHMNRETPWRLFTNSNTWHMHLERRNAGPPLINIEVQLIVVDSCYAENGSHKYKPFIPDDVVVLVKGEGPVGQMFSTGREIEEDLDSLECEYVKIEETVLPELTAPERILVCRF